jgi:hypothetical protein
MIRKFLKRNYRVKMFVSLTTTSMTMTIMMNNNNVDSYNNDSSFILNSNIQSPADDLKSIAKVEQDGNLILFKSFNSCKICNLIVIVNLIKLFFL